MEKFVLSLYKLFYRIYSATFPKAAGRSALRLFQRPRKLKLKKREKQFYDTWNHFSIEGQHGDIPCYDHGDPDGSVILLVHGWESNAGSMSGIGNALAQAGYYVVTFDLPGHGNSKLNYCNLYVAGSALRMVIQKLKLRTDKPLSVISHSFGSATTAFGLSKSDLKVDHLIFLTSPNSISKIFRDYKEQIGLGDKAYDELIDEAYSIVYENVANIVVSHRLSYVDYSKLTLIHDKYDKIIPYRNSEIIHRFLPNTELITFERIGHYRMLWNPDLIKAVMMKLDPEARDLLKNVTIDPFESVKETSPSELSVG